MKTIGTITGEGFACAIHEDCGRVYFLADGDIDADGANGQNGKQAAYMVGDAGSEALANGGMGMRSGKVVCVQQWAKDIVILDRFNQPRVFPGGIIASTTWYRHRDKAADDPAAYVDSETVPYIVVPPLIIQHTVGAVRGCKARVSLNGLAVNCVVADKGPRTKIGEISIAAARAIGVNPSPRTGGTNAPEILYELWPGVPADGFVLQAA